MAWIDIPGSTAEGSPKETVRQIPKDGEVLHKRGGEEKPALQGISLRPYQKDIIGKMKWALNIPGSDVVMLAQGGGKSVIIAHFANEVKQDVLILQPSRELLAQNVDKLARYVDKSEIGIYSASFNSKDIRKFTFGTIQSCYKHPELFTHFKIVLLDECSLYNPKNFEGMYNRFFKDMGNPKLYGFTGTPYRSDVFYEKVGYFLNSVSTLKMINRYSQRVWDRMLCVINTRDLVSQGYLTPIIYLNKELIPIENVKMNKSQSDFDLDAYSQVVDHQEILDTIHLAQQQYKSIIVFCPTIEVAELYNAHTSHAMVVSSITAHKDRKKAISDFRAGKVQVAFNVGVLIYGFDHPQLDCIILARPTRSLILYSQMVGRLTRLFPGKTHGTVIDLTGTVRALGELESIEVKKVINDKGSMMWNVVSSAMPEGFHYQPLYRYRLRKKDEEVQ